MSQSRKLVRCKPSGVRIPLFTPKFIYTNIYKCSYFFHNTTCSFILWCGLSNQSTKEKVCFLIVVEDAVVDQITAKKKIVGINVTSMTSAIIVMTNLIIVIIKITAITNNIIALMAKVITANITT